MKNLRTLCWKELRENFKWALLAGVIVSGAFCYALKYDPNNNNVSVMLDSGLGGRSSLIVTDFGFMLVGLLLGFMQILTEKRRDQWAFLLHRPLTMSEIFFGKAIPGALLYVLATLVPLMAAAWWQSQPGLRPAPFDWRMTLPGLVDIAVGLGFYLAALWSGFLNGPWYGRRALPLIVAWFATQQVTSGNPLWMALEAVVLTLTVIFLASWSAWRAHGIFKKEPWWGKAATVLAVLLSLTVMRAWVMTGWNWTFGKQNGWSDSEVSYRVTKQGEFVKAVRNHSNYDRVETLDGKELKPEKKRKFEWEDFLNHDSLKLNFWEWQNRKSMSWRNYFRQPSTWYSPIYFADYNANWYYDINRQRMVGYDRAEKNLLGWLGTNGFTPAAQPEKLESFKVSPRHQKYYTGDDFFQSDDAVYLINFKKMTVQTVYRQMPDDPYVSVAYIPDHTPRNVEKTADFVVVTEKSINVFSADSQLLWNMPRPGRFAKGYLTISRMDDKSRYFFIFSDYYSDCDYASWLMELDADGHLIKQIEMPAKKEEPPTISDWEIREAIYFSLGQRIWNEWRDFAWARWIVGEKYKPIWSKAQPYLNFQIIYWSISLAIGVACAAVGSLFVKRLRVSRSARVGWLVFIVFYGIGGLLAFWIVNDWPLRLTCPKCGKKRSAGDAECEHCGAAWTLPVRDGTEIFEE